MRRLRPRDFSAATSQSSTDETKAMVGGRLNPNLGFPPVYCAAGGPAAGGEHENRPTAAGALFGHWMEVGAS